MLHYINNLLGNAFKELRVTDLLHARRENYSNYRGAYDRQAHRICCLGMRPFQII